MYTAENAPGVAVLLSGDADVPGPLTGLPTHQDNLDTVIGRYSRLIVVGADADLGAVLTRLLRTDRLDVEVGYVPRRRRPKWGPPRQVSRRRSPALERFVRGPSRVVVTTAIRAVRVSRRALCPAPPPVCRQRRRDP